MLVILKILLVALLIEFLPDYKVNDVRYCPAFEPFDWVAITHLLTADNLQHEREKASIKAYSINEYEFMSKTGIDKNYTTETQEDAIKYLDALNKYWTSKGIIQVTDTTICTAITEVISNNYRVNEPVKELLTRSYFKINGKYFVIYKPSADKISSPTTVLVLNNRFEIETRFGM